MNQASNYQISGGKWLVLIYLSATITYYNLKFYFDYFMVGLAVSDLVLFVADMILFFQ